MLTDQVLRTYYNPTKNTLNEAWLSGAKAGLRQKSRTGWLWEDFIEEIHDQLKKVHIPSTNPGDEPIIEHRRGSAFDALGGYVSVVGDVTPKGLLFPVSIENQERLTVLLSGIQLLRKGNNLLIPDYDISCFLKLVPVSGPVAEWIEDFT
jgi:hypothetical protein